MPKTIADLAAGTISATTQLEVQNGSDGQKITGQDILDFVGWEQIGSVSMASVTEAKITGLVDFKWLFLWTAGTTAAGGNSVTTLRVYRDASNFSPLTIKPAGVAPAYPLALILPWNIAPGVIAEIGALGSLLNLDNELSISAPYNPAHAKTAVSIHHATGWSAGTLYLAGIK